jgi:large subunit ribosomal protein L27
MSIFKLDLQFFAQKKGGGSASTNRSHKSYNPKSLGVKEYGGEYVRKGTIIVCQHGTKYKIKKNDESVFLSKNYTIHAKHDGIVKYFTKGRNKKTYVKVLSSFPPKQK